MQSKDISTEQILNYLVDRQGQWTSLWNGHFKDREEELHMGKKLGFIDDVYYAMPEGTPPEIALAKMKSLYHKGFIGGCPCGCRGDFEITDLGLAVVKKKRTKDYTGYGEAEGSMVTGLSYQLNQWIREGYTLKIENVSRDKNDSGRINYEIVPEKMGVEIKGVVEI